VLLSDGEVADALPSCPRPARPPPGVEAHLARLHLIWRQVATDRPAAWSHVGFAHLMFVSTGRGIRRTLPGTCWTPPRLRAHSRNPAMGS
jgi:hypothetical protein